MFKPKSFGELSFFIDPIWLLLLNIFTRLNSLLKIIRRISLFLLVFFFLAFNADAQLCATPGQDGTTNSGKSINTYYPPLINTSVAAGTKSIVLGAVPPVDSYGNNFGTTPIIAGDLLMIIQMQDADIDFSNSPLYGAGNSNSGPDVLGGTGYVSLGSSGKFEFLVATNSVPLSGGLLTFKGAGVGNGTVSSYVSKAPTQKKGKSSFQIIRVTQYSNLTLSSNISPPPFNGSVGGVIAFDVSGIMKFNGYVVDVSGKGFRGGYSLKKTPTLNFANIYVTDADDSRASGKGEGIAGTPRYMWDGFNQIDNLIEGLPHGSAGRGAPANAGGGGNDTNSGGGGGGSGGAGGVGAWGYENYGGTFPNGGRPGSEIYSSSVADITRLIMGGGGGGGHANDALTGVKGGVGGGIVFISARTITGNATILANGGNGAPGTYGGHPDGSGGGGAGGTVFIKVSQPDPNAAITIGARGGMGGNTENDDINGVQPHGPGGGGGGGIVLYSIPSGNKSIDVSAGISGKTNSGNGSPHHAEGGRPGISQVFNVGSLPPYLQEQGLACYPQLNTDVKEVDPVGPKLPGSIATFTISITNTATDGNAGGVTADVMLPAGLSFKSATVVYTGAAGGPSALTNKGLANRPLIGDFNIPPGDKVIITFLADIDCSIAPGTYNTSVQALYLDPTRDASDPTRKITAVNGAFQGSNTVYQNASTSVPGSNYNGTLSQGEEVLILSGATNTLSSTNPNQVCAGIFDPAPITGTGPFSGLETYQWQSSPDNVNFTDIATATTKDYDPPVINATVYYRRIVTSGSCTSTSNVVSIKVTPPITSNLIAAPVLSFCGSQDPPAIIGSVPTGGDGTFQYQWESSADDVNYTDITGAVQKDYDPPVISSTIYYRRKVMSGGCETASNNFSILVQPPIANNQLTGPIIMQLCGSGDPGVITGSVPTGGYGVYTYQWQISADGINFNDIPNEIQKDYDPPVLSTTTYYRRNVMSGGCSVSTGNIIKISVTPPLINNIVLEPPVIAFCDNGNPLHLSGFPPSGGTGTYGYQWQISADGVNFTDVAGATSIDFSPVIVYSVVYYRRRVSSGLCETISNVVEVNVQAQVASNQVSTPAVTVFCGSGDATLIAGSVPTGGNGTYNYQWQSSVNGVNFTDIPAATLKDYDPPLLNTTTYYRRSVISGLCGLPAISNVILVTIQPLLANNSLADPLVVTFCNVADPESITGSLPAGGNGIYAYQWQSSADGVSFADINGAALKDYDPPVINVSTYYRRKVTAGTCDDISNVIVITVQPQISNNQLIIPAATSFCAATDIDIITGSQPTGGDGSYTYQWQMSTDGVNFNDIPAATSKDYDPPVISTATAFRRVVTSGSCTRDISNIIQFFAQPQIISNQITTPTVVAFCGNGDPDAITGSLPSGGDGSYSYQWQRSANGVNFTVITGATAKNYNPRVISATTYYRRMVISGNCQIISNVVQMTVQPAISTNNIIAPAIASFCQQGDPALIVGNVPPGAFTFNYQWQSSADNISFSDIPGALADSYDPPVLTATTYFRRIVNSAVCVVPLISNTVTIVVDPPVSNNSITAPVVTAFCISGNPEAVIGSVPSGGSGNYVYQWQSSSNNVSFSNIPGAVQKDYDPTLMNNSMYYRRTVTSGNCTAPAISNVVKITIDPAVAGNTLNIPANTAFCGNGQPGSITGSTPTGGNGSYSYQWQMSADNSNFSNILGAIQKDYDPGLVSSSVYYRRVVTSGSCLTPLSSNIIAIKVDPPVANNVITPPAVIAFCSTGNADVINGSTPTGGNGTYSYQWQSSADNTYFANISGATGKNFDPPVANSTVYYRRSVTSGICNVPANSNVVAIIIDEMPVIALMPQVTICRGGAATLSTSGNPNYSYQWLPVTGLSNSQSPNPTATPTVTTTYTVVVSNGLCSTTHLITVNVIPPPTVYAGKDKEILKGNSVLLDATTTGNDLQYSWSPATYLDNPNILTPTASPTEDITYTLTVTSPNNCFVVYDEVFIRVYPKINPPNTFTPNNDGINDVWEIPGLSSYPNGVISIFNRNGTLLHRSTGYPVAWNGAYNGKPVPFGTYYYVIDLKNGSKVISGWVAVAR